MLHEGNISPTNTTRGEISAPTGSLPNSPPMSLPGQCMLRLEEFFGCRSCFRLVAYGGYVWLCFFFIQFCWRADAVCRSSLM